MSRLPQESRPGLALGTDGSQMELIKVKKPFEAIIIERTTQEGLKLYLHKDGWWRPEPHQMIEGKCHYTGYYKKLRKVRLALEAAKQRLVSDQ